MSLARLIGCPCRRRFVRLAPPGRAALYERPRSTELRRTFPDRGKHKDGDHAPDFTLPNPSGTAVSLSALLRSCPCSCEFYRGGLGSLLATSQLRALQPGAGARFTALRRPTPVANHRRNFRTASDVPTAGEPDSLSLRRA